MVGVIVMPIIRMFKIIVHNSTITIQNSFLLGFLKRTVTVFDCDIINHCTGICPSKNKTNFLNVSMHNITTTLG